MGKRFSGKYVFLASLLIVMQLLFSVPNAYAESTLLPPSNLSYQLLTPDDVKITWSAVYQATGYNIYEIDNGQMNLLGTTKSSYYTINNLPEGSRMYVVSTLGVDGESGPGAPITVDTVYPSMTAPTALTNTIKNGNDIVLKWAASPYAENYNVYGIATDGSKTLINSATGTTYTVSNSPEGTSTFAVSAVNSLYGESPLSTEIKVDVVYPTMAVPTNFKSTINGYTVNLSWGSVLYATGYKVYQIIDGQETLISTVTGTSLALSNQAVGDYTYVVHSYSDRFGESARSIPLSLTVSTVTIAPPSNFLYQILNGNDIKLSWGSVPYATSYKVYQVIDDQEVLKSTVTGTSVTYAKQPAGDYTFVVHAYSSVYGESVDSSLVTLTIGAVTMLAPTNFAYTIKNGNDIALTWDAMSNATSYKVYQISNGQEVLKSTVTGTSVTYANQPAGDYTFEVKSFSSSFGESAEGSQVSLSLVFPIMQPPANVVQTIKDATSFSLNWEPADYATSYKVYQISNGQKVLKNTVTGTTTAFSNMSPGDYTYEVHSYSSRFGESANGTQLTFTLNGQSMQAPTNLTYSIANGNDVTLRWTAVPYATSYKVYQVVNGEAVLKSTVTSTSATLTNQPEGNYDFIVDSVSTILGESPTGAEVTFSLVFPTMAVPQNLTYTIQNGNNVVLKWGTVPYATSYKVYELVNGQEVLKATTSYLSTTITNVASGDHTYVVHSSSTRFGDSDGAQLTMTMDQVMMQPPTNLTQTIVNGNSIVLRWNGSTYATAYKVYQVVDGQEVLKSTVTSTSVTYTNQPAGDYTFVVHSYSDRFGESADSVPVSVTVNIITMEPPANLAQTITNGNTLVLKWNSSIYATSYKIYQVIDGQEVLKSTVTGTSVTYLNQPEGDYTFVVYSYSTKFGQSPTGSTLNFTLVWPVVQPPVLSGDVFNANNITLTWKPVQWANEYRVYDISSGSPVLLYKGTKLSYKIYNLSEATHSYIVTAYNKTFGESASSNAATEDIIYPVMQPPAARLQLLSPTSAVLSWDFVPYSNGYNIYEIIDGKPVLLVENLNNLSYSISNLTYANHQYYVTSYSNSFGESQPSNTVTAELIVDTLPPVTTVSAPTGWTNQRVDVTLSATDDITGVANTYFSINGAPFVEGTTFTIDEEGSNKVSFYSVDNAGNKEVIQTVEVKIDKAAPVTTANTPTTWTNADVNVTLNATDIGSGVAQTYYSINGAPFVEGTIFTIDQEGVDKVSFYSVDNAGNKEAIQTVEVKIDKTAPVVSMDLNNEYKLGTSLQLSYLATDRLSGVATEKMTVIGSNTTTGTEVVNGGNVIIDQPGVYNVSVTVTDAAGNTTTVQKQFTVYIPASIEVTPTVIKGNSGAFTVRVSLPTGFSTQSLDLNTATLNGVKALNSNNGYYNQAKIGQFKFERADFNWTQPSATVEFRGYVNGYLVIGQTNVKVQK